MAKVSSPASATTGGAPSNDPTAAAAIPAPGAAPAGTPAAAGLNWTHLLTMADRPSCLSKAGTDYATELQTRLEASGMVVTTAKSNTAEVRIVSTPDDTMCFFLLFAESSTSTDGIPLSEKIDRLVKEDFVRYFPATKRVLQSVVIDPTDYSRAPQMAMHIRNSLMFASRPELAITPQVLQSDTYVFSTNATAVNAFITQYGAHGVTAAYDVGVLISRKMQVGRQNVFGQALEVQTEPLMVVLAKTNFIQTAVPGRGTQMFVPIVTVTDIISPVAHETALAIALPVAAEALIFNRKWLAPYLDFGRSGMNIGNLIIQDGTNALWSASSMAEVEQFVQRDMVEPYLAIQIKEGRARIPGIELALLYTPKEFMVKLSGIYGADMTGLKLTADGAGSFIKEYSGVVNTKQGYIDTELVDFLHLAGIMGIHDDTILRQYLNLPVHVKAKLDLMAATFPDIRPLYTTVTAVLQGSSVDFLSSLMSRWLRPEFDATFQKIDTMGRQLALSNANLFGGGNMAGPGSVFTPQNTVYHW